MQAAEPVEPADPLFYFFLRFLIPAYLKRNSKVVHIGFVRV
jgi:hypothetical protein